MGRFLGISTDVPMDRNNLSVLSILLFLIWNGKKDKEKIMDANERFEIIGLLYNRSTGHLRPGKDDSHCNSSSPENIQRFEEWLATKAFRCALEAIHERDLILESVREQASIVPELNMSNYNEEEVSELNEGMVNISLMVGA
jgi:hypothetical protein